ncbi:MAG: SDR family oxidoreductase [Geminicoccaceae bacterium]
MRCACGHRRDRRGDGLRRGRAQGARLFGRVRALDVTKSAAVTATADALQARLGRIDILVANAGIAKGSPGEEMSDEEWLLVLDINLNGVFWCNRAFGRHMLARGSGSIVNIGSMSGLILEQAAAAERLQRIEVRGAHADEVARRRVRRAVSGSTRWPPPTSPPR